MEGEKRYCEDFCPVYKAIHDYNINHEYKISCSTEMCKHITEVCEKNQYN